MFSVGLIDYVHSVAYPYIVGLEECGNGHGFLRIVFALPRGHAGHGEAVFGVHVLNHLGIHVV